MPTTIAAYSISVLLSFLVALTKSGQKSGPGMGGRGGHGGSGQGSGGQGTGQGGTGKGSGQMVVRKSVIAFLHDLQG